MQEIYRVKTSPVALSDNMIIGEKKIQDYITDRGACPSGIQ